MAKLDYKTNCGRVHILSKSYVYFAAYDVFKVVLLLLLLLLRGRNNVGKCVFVHNGFKVFLKNILHCVTIMAHTQLIAFVLRFVTFRCIYCILCIVEFKAGATPVKVRVKVVLPIQCLFFNSTVCLVFGRRLQTLI